MKHDNISLQVILSIIATGALSFCGVLAETAMNIAFPTLITEFQVGTATVQWLTTIYLLTLSIVVPLSGYLKHSLTNKKIFMISTGSFLLGIILAAIAPNFSMLLIGRAVQGIATGLALPLMFNIILEQVPKSKIGMMMGIGTMIPAIAPAIGPIFGGVVITQLGWRYVFILLIPVIVLITVIGLMSIKQVSALRKSSFDLVGLVEIGFVFLGLILGSSNMGEHGFMSPFVMLPLLVSVISGMFYFKHAKGKSHPILRLSLLFDAIFSCHVLSYFIIQLVLMGLVFILPNFVQLVNGLNPQQSGFVIFPGAALGALLTPFAGIILDKFGAKKPIIIGSMTLFISLLLFMVFIPILSPLLIGCLYFMFTLGIGFSFGNIMTNGINSLVEEDQADGNAIIMTFQQVAGAMGTSVIASILAISQSDKTLPIAESTQIGSRNGLICLLLLIFVELILIRYIFKRQSS